MFCNAIIFNEACKRNMVHYFPLRRQRSVALHFIIVALLQSQNQKKRHYVRLNNASIGQCNMCCTALLSGSVSSTKLFATGLRYKSICSMIVMQPQISKLK